MTHYLALLPLVFAVCANAAQITRVEGKVRFEGKPVSKGFVIQEPGELSTAAGSKATVLLSDKDGKSEIALAPESRCRIEPGDQAKAHVLLNGSLRARLQDKTTREKFALRTSTAVMGVRGTDFMAVFQPLLEESEIVVFEGTVKFGSSQDEADTKDVAKGYWGGIGGRYGRTVSNLIQLPPHALREFDTKSAF